ncbi:hypothetical protein [Heyndrickxia camelliae]|uniref:Uncharacterized protein n=1 Tax=Heyndrickxia camelliae TaxID=1707093 RepID=A0A2N3LEG8_9BACI|nr:hypothetical protein [Heyndrickxia camelliae]PKR83018.1 hypothetical protein CWO92_20990 [Heyndrickxia camelliae]
MNKLDCENKLKKENTNWKQTEHESYFSYHIIVSYFGDLEPKYHVLKNADGEGWVIGVFYSFIGEYVPLEEGENQLVFPTSKEAMNYVDMVENTKTIE